MSAIPIEVNGEAYTVAANLTVAGLLQQMGLLGRPCAVELNGRLIPKISWDSQALAPNDRLEIVTLVGGG